ncbi:TonB-dependent receptor domain-containing protein [Maribacter polysaccharolyticus]|uniref:TonB-dependent receptor domain-containing protein n=1 Tax=Maribacter polysaccharolyticus TaxID=3020831 RepID=UPI00237FD020|nr:TonB-dependent receptor [Maribacter polysaccharolyticus]MDE3743377.1 TonB-dependent receptor [Maribacter polysaccharolyticus]
MKHTFLVVLLCTSFTLFAQNRQEQRPNLINITGTVLDEDTGEPLEYATLIVQSLQNPDKVTGGITDASGKFNVEIVPGKYTAKIEYMSYKSHNFGNQDFTSPTDLGTVRLALDVEQLQEVEVVAERTTVELRLDKKIYNVGSDLTVKGGSVTDVLDNVPSVSVDVEGTISLRGNESVRILINGKPSALSGLSTDALQQLPAEAIEKVEVITNPSARYDAEGTAGILNIVLKQSKTAGINGSVSLNAGYPESYGGNVSLNLRRDKFNIFTNTSYRYRNSPGNALFEQEYFNDDGSTASFQDEIRDYERQSDGFNTNVGFELFIDETSSITNSFVYRTSGGDDNTDVDFYNYDALMNPTIQRKRYSVQSDEDSDVQYSLNYKKNFEKDGHELTMDYQYSSGNELENTIIDEYIIGGEELPTEQTISDEKQVSQLLQMDYVLPLGKDSNSQFELGYRGTFNNYNTDFDYGILTNGVLASDPDYSNELNYKEYVNSAYTQFGSKINKFNILGGLRMEASDIGVELVNTNETSNKTYVDWFPSLFVGYEFTENEQFTISYSRRLRRPRSRYINPFPSRESNTNLFQGNPDLDPTYTNAFDLGYLKRWNKVTFNTSAYYNHSTGAFEFITEETGDFVEIENSDDPDNPIVVPVQVRTPVNLADERRFGMEVTTSYVPKKNWRLSWNLNIYQQQTRGDYVYTNYLNEEVVQNFDVDNFTYFSRLSAKIPLPGAIDFQSNIFYKGPSKSAQTKYKSLLMANLAFSKDVVKDKATVSVNVSDLFNTRKRRSETVTDNVFTYSEFQRRERQITLSFLYRFNQPQNHKGERNGQRIDGDDEDLEFQGQG